MPSAATIADSVWDEAGSGHTTAGTFGRLQAVMGKWEVTGNQLICYALDGTTVLFTFNLPNVAGDPASIRVYKRQAA